MALEILEASQREVQLIERAASQQIQALAKLRQAQNPGQTSSRPQRYQLLLRVLEHLVRAQHYLRCAQANGTAHSDLAATVDAHLRTLTAVQAQAEQLS